MNSKTRKLLSYIKQNLFRQNPYTSPWKSIVSKDQKYLQELRASGQGQKILCATSVGSHEVVTCIDSLVAMGLYMRGAEPIYLLCDGTLPACEASMIYGLPSISQFMKEGPKPTLCDSCFQRGVSFYKPLPITIYKYSDFITQDEIAQIYSITENLSINECYTYQKDSMQLGEQARAGVLRFFGKADLSTENPDVVLSIVRRYLAGAITAASVAEKAIDQIKPDCLVAHHGIYVPQGALGAVARKKGVRVVNWGPSYRNTTAIYSHGDTYHHTFLNEPTHNWENRILSENENQKLDEYLQLRRDGKGDWSWITPDRGTVISDENLKLASDIGIDVTRPTFGLLTNVLWDAQLLYSNSLFTDMLDWLFTTLDYFILHPELQLIVRIHPHEVKQGNRQPTDVEIANHYPVLPNNIKIINNDAPFSTYALMDLCRVVLIYGTKTGVELTPFGQPVITAGEAWIRNKGITSDANSREEYIEMLKKLPEMKPLSPAIIERARRYAYHYFFRRMIPISSLDPEASFPPRIKPKSLLDLMPGKDPGLDVICEGILTGKEFIYDK